MSPISFPEKNVTFAENQPEYLPLPAHRTPEGEVISCWKFSWRERIAVLFGKPMWFRQSTFNQLLQPQLPTMELPFRRND